MAEQQRVSDEGAARVAASWERWGAADDAHTAFEAAIRGKQRTVRNAVMWGFTAGEKYAATKGADLTDCRERCAALAATLRDVAYWYHMSSHHGGKRTLDTCSINACAATRAVLAAATSGRSDAGE